MALGFSRRQISIRIVAWACVFLPLLESTAQALESAGLVGSMPAEFAIVGDAGKWAAGSKAQLESIQRSSVRSLIMPGDNLYSGTYANAWGPWRKAGISFDIVAIGNHNDGYANEVAFFGMPGPHYAKSLPGVARFIVLNSDDKSSVAEQMTFLDDELQAATEPLLFLVYHHPTYTLSNEHKWTERKNFQIELRRRFELFRKKITAVLVGHDHLAEVGHFGDLPFILSGASWEVRRDSPVNNIQEHVAVRTDWYFDGVPYWTKLSFVDGVGGPQARFDFIRASDDRRSCTVLIETGKEASLQPNCSVP